MSTSTSQDTAAPAAAESMVNHGRLLNVFLGPVKALIVNPVVTLTTIAVMILPVLAVALMFAGPDEESLPFGLLLAAVLPLVLSPVLAVAVRRGLAGEKVTVPSAWRAGVPAILPTLGWTVLVVAAVAAVLRAVHTLTVPMGATTYWIMLAIVVVSLPPMVVFVSAAACGDHYPVKALARTPVLRTVFGSYLALLVWGAMGAVILGGIGVSMPGQDDPIALVLLPVAVVVASLLTLGFLGLPDVESKTGAMADGAGATTAATTPERGGRAIRFTVIGVAAVTVLALAGALTVNNMRSSYNEQVQQEMWTAVGAFDDRLTGHPAAVKYTFSSTSGGGAETVTTGWYTPTTRELMDVRRDHPDGSVDEYRCFDYGTVIDPAMNCYVKTSDTAIGYVQPKWANTSEVLLPFGFPRTAQSAIPRLGRDDGTVGDWSVSGNTYTYVTEDGTDVFTVADTVFTHEFTPSEDSWTDESSVTTVELVDENRPFVAPASDEVFTDAEWEQEQEARDQLYQQ